MHICSTRRRLVKAQSFLHLWPYCATLLLNVTLLFGLTGHTITHAQSLYPTVESRDFPETGHTLSGEFLAFYERTPNARIVYGFPITEAFIDPVYGRMVQYFQKARFELFPNEPLVLRVRLSDLGEWLYEPGQPRALAANSPSCRTFYPEGESKIGPGFQVCYAFLDFFLANGGINQFGNPISNLESHDGRFVQYFQKARFEWHPQFPSGQRVQLTNLGSIYFNQQAVDQNYLRQGDNIPQTILHLHVRAYPQQAVTGLQGHQVIYIVVQDQNLLPVANANITLLLRTPSGTESSLPVQIETDQKGLARLTFPFETKQPGLFTLMMTAQLGDLLGQTSCSFRAWW